MAIHSHVKIWIHLIWGTFHHERILFKELRIKLFEHLVSRAEEMRVSLEKLNVQPEHIHCLFSLPSDRPLANIVKTLKGESSHWINESGFLEGKFRWQRGFGAFSISMSRLDTVKQYIHNQEEHHKRKSFLEEYKEWAQRYGVWDDSRETVKTVET
ncbi:MAG: IS200/IS605 family transposase [Candidatus Eremiobacteraeota bacterium]|nr:IS200/IS605 family transposase [Candidatus Eremiobacteraeota bacterium]